MKTIKEYIFEAFDSYNVKDLLVIFTVKNYKLTIEVPESFLEDQILLYLDDTIINKTFVGPDNLKKILGTNSDNITDAYFLYKGIIKTTDNADYKFDSRYNNGGDYSKEKLNNVTIKDFLFVVTFDKFEYKKEEGQDTLDILYKIFDAAILDENENTDCPVDFELEKQNITFKE